jgi:hypothetical protein
MSYDSYLLVDCLSLFYLLFFVILIAHTKSTIIHILGIYTRKEGPTITHYREEHIFEDDNEFRCPECASGEHDGDFFCSFVKCPEPIPQPRFPSANSSLSPGELEEVVECIEQANDILLTLGLERDPENPNLRGLQQVFRKLRNHFFAVTIHCGEEHEEQTLKGHLIDSGLDFIIIQTDVGNIVMIPFERIALLVRLLEEEVPPLPDKELLTIDPCLRRALTFHFGKVVSKSPFLVNLFFGLELKLFLESYVGSFIYVRSERDEKERDGKLTDVKKRRIVLEVDQERQGIEFDEICYVEIEKFLLARELIEFNENPIVL